jgi:hypothetical protein
LATSSTMAEKGGVGSPASPAKSYSNDVPRRIMAPRATATLGDAKSWRRAT